MTDTLDPLRITREKACCCYVRWSCWPTCWTMSFNSWIRNNSSKRERRHIYCEEQFHSTGKHHFVERVELPTTREFPALIEIDSSDCSITKVLWTFQTIGVYSTSDCYFFAVKFRLWNLSWGFCPPHTDLNVSKSWDLKDSLKIRSEGGNQNRTTCSP